MIATGNHNFERFAALCNTLPGEAWALRAGKMACPLGTDTQIQPVESSKLPENNTKIPSVS